MSIPTQRDGPYGELGPYVVCVILNTNRREDSLACLQSLKDSTYERHDVVVLDNHSTDGSVEAVRTAFPDVETVSLARNLGYAGNNNVGIGVALEKGADWVFVLNEDVVLGRCCLETLVRVGEGDPGIGILGPMVYHYDEPTIIQSAGGRLGRFWESSHIAQNEPDTGHFQEPRPVEWISGCGILVRRAVIEQVGMLDERFFIYWEETEWCLRARKSGWKVVHVPQARLWHKGVQRHYRPMPLVTYYLARNRFLMMAKHHAPVAAWVGAWLQTLRTLASWSLRGKWRSMREHRDAMWRAVMDFLRCNYGEMRKA